jgi:hypothetical protein
MRLFLDVLIENFIQMVQFNFTQKLTALGAFEALKGRRAFHSYALLQLLERAKPTLHEIIIPT